jgi:5-methylcytosine-specific restriction protein A
MVTDHIVPKTQGGTDDASNLQTLCERCHNVKTTTIDAGGWSNVFRRGQ